MNVNLKARLKQMIYILDFLGNIRLVEGRIYL
jgi:hypothetical protein